MSLEEHLRAKRTQMLH